MSNEDTDRYELSGRILAQFLRMYIDFEQTIETAKISLLENHLFNPFVAYQYFDRYGQGYATRSDIYAFFKNNPIEDIDITEEDMDYVIFHNGRVNEYQPSLSRPDGFFYEHFLNMITPANNKKLLENISDGKYVNAGKNRQLSVYVFDMFHDLLAKQIRCFRGIQEVRLNMINRYGYTANPAYKKIAGDNDRVTFYDMKLFMEKEGYSILQSEFNLISSLLEGSYKLYISKSNFLNIFTPFDSALYSSKDRRYESLTNIHDRRELDDYVKNTYNYTETHVSKPFEDPRLKETARIMQNLYSNHQEVDEYSKKNLKVTPEGKVMYDIRKKVFPYYNISGYKDNYDQYHRTMYQEAKNDTHEYLLKQPVDRLRNDLNDDETTRRNVLKDMQDDNRRYKDMKPADTISKLKQYMVDQYKVK